MKLLILGIDAMDPDVIFNNLNKLPNIKNLVSKGCYGDYDAYAYGYGSSDNWISLYTGLTPKQHGIIGNILRVYDRTPRREDYADKKPFWELLNKKGVTVGLWKGLNTTPTRKIDGYMIGGEPNYEIDNQNDPLGSAKPLFCEEDKKLKEYISGNIENPPMPRKAQDFGFSWDELLENPDLINQILTDDYFEECVDYLKKELNYYKDNIINMQEHRPVDLLFFYTAIIDFLAHFQMHAPKKRVIIEAYKVVDNFIGEMIEKLNPNNIIVMSDHGIKALADFFPNTSTKIQKESFGWRDKSIWLENGQIITKARNKGIMSGIHAIKGSFIATGEDIKPSKLEEMRTIDFYPTLLELFDIKVPKGREGYVLDIFKDKEIINKEKLLTKDKIKRENIAIIQDMEVSEFNRVINEVFLDHRFAKITIFGEEKYKNIFSGNPRIDDFIIVDDFELDFKELEEYDKVFISYRNRMTDQFSYISISK
ncbi:alkaline phosphatase family protein [Natroniella sp. ANB-PHB2]|uniref:alkaline phosphatase family protein n=1 Tax=Natroniella sp. ANB-PHB2 TaxID=3384444 RepID=UPI0038D50BC4